MNRHRLLLVLLVLSANLTAALPSAPAQYGVGRASPYSSFAMRSQMERMRQMEGGAAARQFADDSDMAILLAAPEAQSLTAEERQAIASLRQLLGNGQLARRPLQVLQALGDPPPAEQDTESSDPASDELEGGPPASEDVEEEGYQARSPADFILSRDSFGARGAMDEEEMYAQQRQPPAPLSPLARRLLVGDWRALGDFLKGLPEGGAGAAYSDLLSLLVADAGGVILPQEILPLAEAAPGELSDRDLAHLGFLARRGLQQAEKLGDLLAALDAGTPQLGGADPARRLAAAKLLLAAGLHEEAGRFLPTIDEALAAQHAAVIYQHARRLFLAAYASENALESYSKRRRSWELTQTVLASPAKELAPFCTARLLALVSSVPRELAGAWCRDVIESDSAEALSMLQNATQQLEQAFAIGDSEGRERGLTLAKMLGEGLLAANEGDERAKWLPALEMLTRAWINEAQKAAGGPWRRMPHENDDEVEGLPEDVIRQSAPSEAWLAAIGPDTAEHARALIGLFSARSGDDEQALAAIRQVVGRDPELAKKLAQELLSASGGGGSDEDLLDEYGIDPFAMQQMPARQRAQYLQMLRRQRSQEGDDSGQGATTRAGQLRSLARLRDLLAAFTAAGAPPLDEESRVAAFANCHSPAEVYRRDDIEMIFGAKESLSPEAALALVETMRAGLAQSWRDPELQRQQGTKRTPADQAAEIVRGYALAQELLARAIERAPERADLLAALGNAEFEHAEFLYGQGADLKTYVERRDAAFTAYEKSAVAYESSLASLPAEQQDVEVHRQWFQAALGASELAYLTRQDEPDETQVGKVAQAIERLGAAAEHHRQLFAEAVLEGLESTPPALKPHLARQAMVVVGEHPAGKPLAERLMVYDELLQEVELRLAIDGPASVGRGRPFAVNVSLAGTHAVLRENDAFAALLTIYPPGMQSEDTNDPRRRLEDELREKLAPGFEIEALAFHPATTRPRATPREGWQELPLASLVLRAKDETIDRLPATALDLEFSDGNGQVRLPVTSSMVLLDAHEKSFAARPASQVTVNQLLDDRELAKGNVRLEIAATARGIVPELEAMLDSPESIPGFKVRQTIDQGVSITSLEAGETIEPLTERRWLVELSPVAGQTPATFKFPSPTAKAYTMVYRRYTDADIVDSPASAPLAWPMTVAARVWIWPAAGLLALLIIVVGVAIWLKRRRATEVISSYRRPAHLTPFSALALLRQIEADERLSSAERQDLAGVIRVLEDQFFGRNAARENLELESVATKWLARVT